MSYNSGAVTANVTYNASATKPVTVLWNEKNGSGSTTLGTVGASKVWKIISIQMSVQSTSGSSAGYLSLNGVKTAVLNVDQASGTSCQTIFLSWDYSACPVVSATQTATITSSSNTYVQASITYIEESV